MRGHRFFPLRWHQNSPSPTQRTSKLENKAGRSKASSLYPEHPGCFLLGYVVADWRSVPKVAFTLIKRQFLASQVEQGTEVEEMQIMGEGIIFEQVCP